MAMFMESNAYDDHEMMQAEGVVALALQAGSREKAWCS
jgi:hypothetical protein